MKREITIEINGTKQEIEKAEIFLGLCQDCNRAGMIFEDATAFVLRALNGSREQALSK